MDFNIEDNQGLSRIEVKIRVSGEYTGLHFSASPHLTLFRIELKYKIHTKEKTINSWINLKSYDEMQSILAVLIYTAYIHQIPHVHLGVQKIRNDKSVIAVRFNKDKYAWLNTNITKQMITNGILIAENATIKEVKSKKEYDYGEIKYMIKLDKDSRSEFASKKGTKRPIEWLKVGEN